MTRTFLIALGVLLGTTGASAQTPAPKASPPSRATGDTQPAAQSPSPATAPATPATPRAAQAGTAFGALDANGDGALTPVELTAQPDMSQQFTRLDADRDGSLSAAEFAAFQDRGTGAGAGTAGTGVPAAGSAGSGTLAPGITATPPPGPSGLSGVQGEPSGGTTGDRRGARDTDGGSR